MAYDLTSGAGRHRAVLTRREPGTVGPSRPWPLLVVVTGVVAGLGVAFIGPTTWRAGALVIGAALLLGAGERLVLPNRAAGLLQVRGKGFDVALLGLTGVAVVVLALAVPAGR